MRGVNTHRYGASAIVLSLALAAGAPARAQTAPAAGGPTSQSVGLQEVVVTARKAEERLQDVPVAVTAFSHEELKQQHALNLANLAGITPGLTVQTSSPQGASNAFISMRGQYQSSALATEDPSIGVYVDGVYWARAYGINANLLDVSNVQVLKGPQGTLFGRNTTGGAVLINSNDPDLSEQSGNFTAEYGRFEYKRGEAVFNAPIVKDQVGVRVAFSAINDDGYVTDINHADLKVGQTNQYNARIKLLAKPTEDLSVLLSAEIYSDNYRPDVGQIVYTGVTSFSNLQAGSEQLGLARCFANTAACFSTGAARLTALANRSMSQPDLAAYTISPITNTKTQTYSATITDNTPIGQAKVIAAYRRVKETVYGDYDGSEVDIDQFGTFFDTKQWSVEGQLVGAAMDGRVSYAGGIFGFGETGLDHSTFTALPALSPNVIWYQGNIDNKSIGIYGQSTFKITDKLSLTGGLRWSRDNKGVTINNGNARGNIFVTTPGSFVCTVAAGCPTFREGTFSGLSYTAGLDYKFSPDLMVYFKASSAFRSGGVNLRETTALPGLPTEPFLPERATSYEAGFKSEFLDRRVRFNVAAYYMVVHDIQREFIVSNGIESTTVAGNAGQADFHGGEADLTGRVFDNGIDVVTLAANAALVIPKYIDYHDLQGGYDRSAEAFPFVPRWQASVTGNYTHQMDFGVASLHMDYIWDSGYQTYPFNYRIVNGVPIDVSTNQPVPLADAVAFRNVYHKTPGGVLNLRTAQTFGEGERYEVALFGQNVMGNRQYVNTNGVQALNIAAIRRPPARWGVSFSAKF
jgi:iron complex outermembrane receptor protein